MTKKERDRMYYLANRDKIKAHQAERRASMTDEQKEQAKQRRRLRYRNDDAHRAKVQEYQRIKMREKRARQHQII